MTSGEGSKRWENLLRRRLPNLLAWYFLYIHQRLDLGDRRHLRTNRVRSSRCVRTLGLFFPAFLSHPCFMFFSRRSMWFRSFDVIFQYLRPFGGGELPLHWPVVFHWWFCLIIVDNAAHGAEIIFLQICISILCWHDVSLVPLWIFRTSEAGKACRRKVLGVYVASAGGGAGSSQDFSMQASPVGSCYVL